MAGASIPPWIHYASPPLHTASNVNPHTPLMSIRTPPMLSIVKCCIAPNDGCRHFYS